MIFLERLELIRVWWWSELAHITLYR